MTRNGYGGIRTRGQPRNLPMLKVAFGKDGLGRLDSNPSVSMQFLGARCPKGAEKNCP